MILFHQFGSKRYQEYEFPRNQIITNIDTYEALL